MLAPSGIKLWSENQGAGSLGQDEGGLKRPSCLSAGEGGNLEILYESSIPGRTTDPEEPAYIGAKIWPVSPPDPLFLRKSESGLRLTGKT